MGVELVEGRDLFVRDNAVYMRTTHGPRRVDVIYRRIDDDILDPLAFRPDSMLGVPGLLSVYRNGDVTLANAIGTGVADDKAIYPYVPDLIQFYLGEKPILGNVPTYRCALAGRSRLRPRTPRRSWWSRQTRGSGGYGMLIGPAARATSRPSSAQLIEAHPDGYIAQPTVALSSCPTCRRGRHCAAPHRFAALHLDRRTTAWWCPAD